MSADRITAGNGADCVLPPAVCPVTLKRCRGFGECSFAPAPLRCSHPVVLRKERAERRKRAWRVPGCNPYPLDGIRPEEDGDLVDITGSPGRVVGNAGRRVLVEEEITMSEEDRR